MPKDSSKYPAWNRDAADGRSGVGVVAAASNLAKICVGSGVMSLPGAVARGGLIFSPLITVLIGLWNLVSVQMIMKCKHLTDSVSVPDNVISQYSKLSYVAFGWPGTVLTDGFIIITLYGVCITYLITCAAMVRDMFHWSDADISQTALILLCAAACYPMACTKDVGFLSPVSMLGLFVLCLALASVFWFGFADPEWSDTDTSTFRYIPETVADSTSYIGVASFCFGISTLAFPVEASMRDKSEFPQAVLLAVVFVCCLYFIVGDGLYVLYSHQEEGVKSNILQNLPTDSAAATCVRGLMAGV